MKSAPIQLTFSNNGHTLHHNQIQSLDGDFLVFDTRNDDTKIGETDTIAVLNLNTNEINCIYKIKNPTIFGPGVGAATFSPVENKVIFIHGINNATAKNPYGMTRRTGVSIHLKQPNIPVYMDARNIYPPFTKGALRGGTHSHAWHPNGNLISFTYNDFYLENNEVLDKDTRVVGVMFPKNVSVIKDENKENNSGEMFSVIVSEVKNKAQKNSDEIEKAFDECWLGNKNAIAFQAFVRNEKDEVKTEIYICNLPTDLTKPGNFPLQGTEQNRCGIPLGVIQKRITYTKGISNFRHWLRSDLNGDYIYFLMEDDKNVTQIFSVQVSSKIIKQITFHKTSIHSPFNIKNNLLVYFNNNDLVIFDMNLGTETILFTSTNEIFLTGIPHFSNCDAYIYFNAFVNGYIQIFKIKF